MIFTEYVAESRVRAMRRNAIVFSESIRAAGHSLSHWQAVS